MFKCAMQCTITQFCFDVVINMGGVLCDRSMVCLDWPRHGRANPAQWKPGFE